MAIDGDYERFENFAARLLERNGLEILDRSGVGTDPGYDFIVKSNRNVRAVVEVKLYRSVQIAWNIVRQSFKVLRRGMRRNDIRTGVLVTNARLPSALRQEASEQGIVVYDYDVIVTLSSDYPDLGEELHKLLQDGFIYRSEPLPPPQPVNKPDLLEFGASTSTISTVDDVIPTGAKICTEIREIKAGRGKSAIAFEKTCTKALKYLFDGDLIGWNEQTKTHNALHRYDIIARIASDSDFWNLMITDHRSRYIIFEFKNYKAQITQTEIYTTEKYLLPVAMRGTSIVISRRGLNSNAYRVAAGALRDTGKLILGLDISQVCEMLHLKDKGEDPSSVIAAELDRLLIGLER